MVANRGSQNRFSSEGQTMATAGASQAREYLSRGYEQAEHLVVHNPMSSLFVLFGVGLGIGMLIGMALSPRERRFSELSTSEKAQRIGRRVRDTVGRIVPERLSHR